MRNSQLMNTLAGRTCSASEFIRLLRHARVDFDFLDRQSSFEVLNDIQQALSVFPSNFATKLNVYFD